jgi:hypothetical protein
VSLRAVPMTLADANEFVKLHHRHHQPAVGHRFSIGCEVWDMEASYARQETVTKLVGVAIIGRPVARKTDQYRVAEVTRLCTDGTKNACSFLYALAARLTKEMGFDRIQTFILDHEPATTLKAAGWIFDGMTDSATASWQTRSSRRTDQPTGTKQRWIKNLK